MSLSMLICRYVKELMTAAGLAIREDPMGNIFGRWEGSDPGAGARLAHSAYFPSPVLPHPAPIVATFGLASVSNVPAK